MVTVGIPSNEYQKSQRSLDNVGDFYSQIFKPITAALRQATMRGIVCTTERVER